MYMHIYIYCIIHIYICIFIFLVAYVGTVPDITNKHKLKSMLVLSFWGIPSTKFTDLTPKIIHITIYV